jgi:hypothetical protein
MLLTINGLFIASNFHKPPFPYLKAIPSACKNIKGKLMKLDQKDIDEILRHPLFGTPNY